MAMNLLTVKRSLLLFRQCWATVQARRGYGDSVSSVRATIGGKQNTFYSGKYAKLADGAAVVQSGNTTVMVTAVSKKSPRENTSWTPLIVDYRERASAAGRIPHNFFRRELRSTDREVLISRCIDRSIRPLFLEGYAYDTQVICNLLALDGIHDQEVLSINGASAALMLSDIPWNGPIAAVRVICHNGKFIVNPTKKQEQTANLNVIVTCTHDKIVMVEGYGHEIEEEKFCEAVKFGMSEAQPLIEALLELQKHKKKAQRETSLILPSQQLLETVSNFCHNKIMDILKMSTHKKMSRDEALFSLRDEAKIHVKESELNNDTMATAFMVEQAFWITAKDCMKSLILDHKIRCDGRGMNELRPIECEVNLFEPLHGSARFARGETQVVCSVTFDSPESAAKADVISLIIGAEKSRSFMVHYEFPPFATNVTGQFMMAGRREVGHGMLAEKALKPLLPQEFPFTIRVASQVTDSNGSSSMATVCGSSLALFDSGVPMTKPAAGVACGLILDSNPDSGNIQRYQILSDLSGIEDALGCMDFKMAGTRKGITSCQVDVKGCHGIPLDIFEEAVMLSRDSRYKVLDIMDQCQSSPRPTLKENGPAYETIEVPFYKRKKIMGVGGYKIRSLIEETGAQLNTIGEETMSIFAPSRSVMDEVIERINQMMNALSPEEQDLKVGAIYNACILEIKSFGFIVELTPGGPRALLHSSQIDHKFVYPQRMGFQIGDKLSVKYLGRDETTDRLQISRKPLLAPPPQASSFSERRHKHSQDKVSRALKEAMLPKEGDKDTEAMLPREGDKDT